MNVDRIFEKVSQDPFARFLGIELLELRKGYSHVAMTVHEHMLNFHGIPHGGAIFTLADAAFAHIVDFIKVGMTEKEVAWELEVFLRTHGAEKVAFDLIVGAGPDGVKPHASATERKIEAGEPIIIDLGALLNGTTLI